MSSTAPLVDGGLLLVAVHLGDHGDATVHADDMLGVSVDMEFPLLRGRRSSPPRSRRPGSPRGTAGSGAIPRCGGPDQARVRAGRRRAPADLGGSGSWRRRLSGEAPRDDTSAAADGQNARYWWTDRTEAEPSPTAAATRLVEPDRRSPTAKRPGWLVSNGSGVLPSVRQSSPSCSGVSDEVGQRQSPLRQGPRSR